MIYLKIVNGPKESNIHINTICNCSFILKKLVIPPENKKKSTYLNKKKYIN